MNFLYSDDEGSKRPPESEIAAANSVIQELIKTNEVQAMEVEFLKIQLETVKQQLVAARQEVKCPQK